MKLLKPIFKPQGSVLVVAMVMTMLGGLFIAGWMGLASMRAAYASNSEYAARRRLMLENSKAMTAQVARQNAMAAHNVLITGPTFVSDGTNTWGGVDLNGGWASLSVYVPPPDVTFPYSTYYTYVHPYNPTGLHPGASFLNTQVFTRPVIYQAVDPTVISADPTYRLDATMNDFSAYLFLKGICPALAGDGLVVYRKPAAESAEIELASNMLINGRLVVRDPAVFFNNSNVNLGAKIRLGTRTKSLYIQKLDERNRITGTDLTGLELLPSNMPTVPSTYGTTPTTVTTADLYRGDLNITQNNSNTANSLWHIQQREADAGRSALQTVSAGAVFGLITDPVYIRDETNPPYPPPAWPSGYPLIWKVLYINLDHPDLPNLRIYGVVNQIVFLGQGNKAAYDAAATMTPRSVIVIPDAAGRTVQDFAFERENNRPLIVAAKGNRRERLDMFWTGHTIPAVATPLTVDWKLIFVNEYRQVSVFPPNVGGVNAVAIVGGFLTNWSIKRLDAGAAANFAITPNWLTDGDLNSFKLASLLPRDAWLETFFQLTPP